METLIVKGDPAEQIVATAKKEGIDLIVMGTHSRKGLGKSNFWQCFRESHAERGLSGIINPA